MRPDRIQPRRGDQAGVTLIELMISVLLASILSTGLFYMMSSQQRTYSEQLSNMTAQQNLVGAMEYLQGQIWKAGYGFTGCGGEVKAVNDVEGSVTITAFAVGNGYNMFTGAADPDLSDSFALTYRDTAGGGDLGVKLVDAMPTASAILKASSDGNIKLLDMLIIWQPGSSFCSLMQASQPAQPIGVLGHYTIQHNSGSPIEWNPANPAKFPDYWPPGGYLEGAIVMNIGDFGTARRYAIDRSRNPPQLVTWKKTDLSDLEVVADGIEDLQIAYACDMNGDGEITEGKNDTERQNDEWAYNVAGDVIPTCVDAGGASIPPALMRVTLIARTAGPIIGDKAGFRPGAEDHLPGTPNDDLSSAVVGGMGTYGRVMLTTTVIPRNIR